MNGSITAGQGASLFLVGKESDEARRGKPDILPYAPTNALKLVSVLRARKS